MNDSLRTNVFVRYTPETIACACIFLAARQLQVHVLYILRSCMLLSFILEIKVYPLFLSLSL